MPPKVDPASQIVRRRGLRDYALDAAGNEIHVRSWDPVHQRFAYAGAAGRAWAAGHAVDYIVLIPVLFRTHRRNGAVQEYHGVSR